MRVPAAYPQHQCLVHSLHRPFLRVVFPASSLDLRPYCFSGVFMITCYTGEIVVLPLITNMGRKKEGLPYWVSGNQKMCL